MMMRTLFLLVLVAMSVWGASVAAQEPSPTPIPDFIGDCIAAPARQIRVGEQAIVQYNDGAPVNVRDRGSTYGRIVGELTTRQLVDVVGGPQCGLQNNLYVWWEIETEDGLRGWVAEGDSFRSRNQYFIAPLEQSSVSPIGVNCYAEVESQVDVGDMAVVNENIGADVALREVPTGRILDYLDWGTALEVVGGPRCGAGSDRLFKWWEVVTESGLQGWVAEGDGTQNPPLYFIRPPQPNERTEIEAAQRKPVDPGCPASPATVLQPGDTVEVNFNGGFPLILRTAPAGSRIGEFEQGDRLEILSGPKCGNFYAWWEVQSADGQTGWVAEGDDTQTPVAFFISLVEATPQADQGATAQDVTASPTLSAGAIAEGSDCEDAPPAQLVVGDPAIVTGNAPEIGIPLKTGPSTFSSDLAQLPAESLMIVLTGPRCGDANGRFTWWQVRTEEGAIGWVQEGDASVSPIIYYVAPVNTAQ